MNRWTTEIINHYRKKMDLSTDDLTTRLGYSSRATIQNWKSSGVPREKLRELVGILNIPKSEMIEAILKDERDELKALLGVE